MSLKGRPCFSTILSSPVSCRFSRYSATAAEAGGGRTAAQFIFVTLVQQEELTSEISVVNDIKDDSVFPHHDHVSKNRAVHCSVSCGETI